METKICRACKVSQPIENFYKNSKNRTKDGRISKCKKCCAEYAKYWKSGSFVYKVSSEQAHKTRQRVNRKYNLKRKIRHKSQVFYHYAGKEPKCAKCGFSDIRALSIDHINGGGCQHKRQLASKYQTIYHWIIDNNYPPDFQILCMNCQFIKRAEIDNCKPIELDPQYYKP